jgi:NAD(P)-dependent dehydrogenase (short-subunit alcohol dehydrogenase family)
MIMIIGGPALFVEHDVGEESAWRDTIDVTLGKFGRLDVVVNNAGLGMAGDVAHTTLEEWRRLMRVNLDGVFLGTKQGRRQAAHQSAAL